MGFAKEYHVWDAVFSELCQGFRAEAQIGEGEERALRRMMQTREGFYETYFAQLVNHTIRWTGDITPSYAMLRADAFAEIKKRLEDAGFSVKVVFLMRDPVERNWSALRMHQRVRSAQGVHIDDQQLGEVFDKFFRSPQYVARTRYDETIDALRKTFSSRDLYVGFYESLFSQWSIGRLSEFLGLDLTYADAGEKVNDSKQVELSPRGYEACRKFYADVYDFCAREYPETKELWRDKNSGRRRH